MCVRRFILGKIKALVLVLQDEFIVSYRIAKCIMEITKGKCNVSLFNDYWIDQRSALMYVQQIICHAAVVTSTAKRRNLVK